MTANSTSSSFGKVKNGIAREIATSSGAAVFHARNFKHLTLEIDKTCQWRFFRSYLAALLMLLPCRLVRFEVSISQRVIFEDGLQAAEFFDLLNTWLCTRPRLLIVSTSGPMVWEWLSKDRNGFRPDCEMVMFRGPVGVLERYMLLLRDRLVTMFEKRRYKQSGYPLDDDDSEVGADELEGMEEIFPAVPDTNPLLPTNSMVPPNSTSTATTATTDSNHQKEGDDGDDDEENENASSIASYNYTPPPDPYEEGEQDESGQWENANGAGAGGGNDGSEEGGDESPEEKEISEEDDESDEDFIEGEASGSEYGVSENDDDD